MPVETSSAPDFTQITSIQTSSDFHQVSDQEEIVRDFINWSIRNEIAHNARLFFLFSLSVYSSYVFCLVVF